MILKRTSAALVLAALVLGSAAALRYAEGHELIGADTAKRTMQVMIGLILAAYSNLMPKDIGPWRASASAAVRSQSALRVGGWALTLAGLGYAAFWAFTPIPFAQVASPVLVATALMVTVAYGGRTHVTGRRQQA
ncbi:hypothetical protein BH23PLA1_BH23PLA1_43300 [soil metagenome]